MTPGKSPLGQLWPAPVFGKTKNNNKKNPPFIGTQPYAFSYVRIIYGNFGITRVELNSCKRDHVALKTLKCFYLTLYRKSLLTLDIGEVKRLSLE